ncbi:hypothetical protein K501DRAFT_17336 [Backusella circina FSU 941]|nr:hypothetical protein K501DRAFT_17336 [Backusella circina FSU 941]
MTGMDLHHPSVGANVWLTINTPTMTKEAIMNEITQRRTSFLFDPAGTRPRVYVDSPATFKLLEPLSSLGDYFGMFYDDNKGMYSFQGSFCQPEMLQANGSVVGWFIFWMLVFVISFELVRWCVMWGTQRWVDYRRRRVRDSLSFRE